MKYLLDNLHNIFASLCRIILILILFSCYSCADKRIDLVKDAFRGYKGNYLLFVSKKEFLLYVYNRDYKIVSRYKIAYGLNPDRRPKLFVGDNRTPEGEYKIIEILSIDAFKNSESYRKIKAMNRVYFRARDGHYKYGKPDEDLGDNAYGPRFFRIDYPNQGDVKRYQKEIIRGNVPLKKEKFVSMGSGIAIHGNCDPGSIGHLASSGCIRMFNDDIVELNNYIQLGTPVIISGD